MKEHTMGKIVSFRQMKDGTREDYLLLDESERDFAKGLPQQIMTALKRLDHSLDGYPLTRLCHSLHTATQALPDGADDQLVSACLLHCLAD